MSIIVASECRQQFPTSNENADQRAGSPECGCEPIISPRFEFVPGIATNRKAIRILVLSVATVLFFGFLWPITTASSIEAARRSLCVNNLKRIADAMSKSIAGSGSYSFPPASIVNGDGKPLLSWRVAILPLIGEQALFDEFHRNEPWDSSHNKALLPRMPAVYRCPSERASDPCLTNYQVIVGPHALLENHRGVSLSEVIDGTSNTMMIAESRNPVPWTKPADLVFDPDGSFRTITVTESRNFDPGNPEEIGSEPNDPLPSFGSSHSNGFNAAFADGRVRFLESPRFVRGAIPPRFDPNRGAMSYGRPLTHEELLRALITRDGGEIVVSNLY